MTFLSVDFETRATVDLRASGVYPYAQHKNTDLWCMAYAFEGEEPEIWYPPHVQHVLQQAFPFPERILDHILEGGEMRAWNAQFERVIWKNLMHRYSIFLEPKRSQWVCTAAEAAAMALPRSLDQAAIVCNIGAKKDQEGYALMMRMTRPRKLLDDGSPVWWDVPERIHRLGAYCMQDVRTEMGMAKVLRRLTPREREVYILDQQMNDTGVPLDRKLVLAMKAIADEGVQRATTIIQEVTGGQVEGVTKVQQISNWVRQQEGMGEVTSIAKAPMRELLESDLSPEVRQVLQLRADAGRASVAKLDSMLEVACTDDVMRGLLLYHGAGTGRWSGKLVQPHNFPRGEVKKVESYIPWVLEGRYDMIDLFEPPVVVISSMLRSTLWGGEGYELTAGDYSAIEARVVNWLAGQQDVLDIWIAGGDVYVHNAARMFKVPLSQVTDEQRQGGKFQELGCGFGMGYKKGVDTAKKIYQLDITEDESKGMVADYRATHFKVVQLWDDCNKAAMNAVSNPGKVYLAGVNHNIKFIKAGSYLYIVLPSGRPLAYPAPSLEESEMPWSTVERPAFKVGVSFFGIDPFTRKWSKQRLYGGLIVENIVQAVARDVMAEAKLRVRDHGTYTPILSVHDEVVSKVRKGEGSKEEYAGLLRALPEWATGLPVDTKVWRGERYRK